MSDESKATTSTANTSGQQESRQLPPVDFNTFISELAGTAFAYLGGLQNPDTKEAVVLLPMAKRVIDTIELLKDKTKGNLTPPESSFVDSTLYNLRMSYVRVASNPPKPPEKTESEGEAPPEKPEGSQDS